TCGSRRRSPMRGLTTPSTSSARSACRTAAGRCRSESPERSSSRWRSPAGTAGGTRSGRSASCGLCQLDEPVQESGEGAGKQQHRQRGGSESDELQLQRNECQQEQCERVLPELGSTLPEPRQLECGELPTGSSRRGEANRSHELSGHVVSSFSGTVTV